MLICAGFALVYPTAIADAVGFGLVIVALVLQFLWRRSKPVPG